MLCLDTSASAVDPCSISEADEIPPLYEQFDAGNATEEDLDDFPGTTVTAKRFKHPACDSLCTSTCRPANALACGDAPG
jgi:hypothetical protein